MESNPERPEEEFVGSPNNGDPQSQATPTAMPAPPRRRVPFPYITMGLILANGVIQVLVAQHAGLSPFTSTMTGNLPPADRISWHLALSDLGWKDNSLIFAGQYWRLITSAFLHAGILHLGGNMIGLWNLGQLIEMMYGARRFLFIYVGGALGGALGSLIGTPSPSVGASGAIFGLLGAGIVFSLRYRHVVAKGAAMSLFRQLVFWAALILGIGFAVDVIDNSGHIGGLVGGMLFTLLVSSRVGSPRNPSLERSVATIGYLAAVLVVGIAFFFIGRGFVDSVAVSIEGTRTRLYRYDNFPADYWLYVPTSWKGETRGGEYLEFFEVGSGRRPLFITLEPGGTEWEEDSLSSLLDRISSEPGPPEILSDPEPVRLESGEGYRVRVMVVEGEMLQQTRYYISRGKMLQVIVFRDAIVAPELRETIVGSLRWRNG
ncbi:MAG: rhomboid family intramembrane serine protease [Planctomycetota bacterium]|nr:rhomboid family intramembrane serine protease [Planctomycetota bacterium]